MTPTEIINAIKELASIIINPGFYERRIIEVAEAKIVELINSLGV